MFVTVFVFVLLAACFLFLEPTTLEKMDTNQRHVVRHGAPRDAATRRATETPKHGENIKTAKPRCPNPAFPDAEGLGASHLHRSEDPFFFFFF